MAAGVTTAKAAAAGATAEEWEARGPEPKVQSTIAGGRSDINPAAGCREISGPAATPSGRSVE